MKLFHNQQAEAFRPAFPQEIEKSSGYATAKPVEEHAAAQTATFSLTPDFWLRLLKEPDVAAEWERRLNADISQVREKVEAEARVQGFAQGVEEGRVRAREDFKVQIEAIRVDLDRTFAGLLAEKMEILHDHSSSLKEALEHVLTKFFIGGSDIKILTVDRWLQSLIKEVPPGEWELRVHPEVYARLQPEWSHIAERYTCKLASDAALATTEVRFSFGTGEFYFSSEEQKARLDSLLRTAGAITE